MRSISDLLLLSVSMVLIAAFALPALAQAPSAEDVVSGSIALHDPESAWKKGTFRLALEESRPDGSVRETVLLIDNANGRFSLESARNGRRIRGELDAESCAWLLDGSTAFSDEEREEFGLTCERLERWRDYYVYLWGMPMKLRDAGTQIRSEVKEKNFEGRLAWEIRVTYDEAVGSDVWYFYFDPADSALIGYRFYHDEAANDGEYITLEGLAEGAGLRLPKSRAWYTHREGEHLGTDKVVAIEVAGRE